jgi:hypothetical protein
MKIIRLPPGEALGARDLQLCTALGWTSRHPAEPGGTQGAGLAAAHRAQCWLDRAEGRRRP